MIDAEIEALVADFKARQQREHDAFFADLRARLRARAPSGTDLYDAGSMVKVPAKLAAAAVGISDSQMRRRCYENMHGVEPGGYGYRDGRSVGVFKGPFLNSLPARDRERALKCLNAHGCAI